MTSSTTSCIITTIFPPTAAIRQFGRVPGLQVIVVGDRKTPIDWACPGVMFLSADSPSTARFRLAGQLPWNHYCRKMLGYLWAMQSGAVALYETDDDNLPLANWHVPSRSGVFSGVQTTSRYCNMYRAYTAQPIWPRGFPLRLLHGGQSEAIAVDTPARMLVGIWQGLANGDPDVDAIYRLTRNDPCIFEHRGPLVLPEGVICPFNSQNTWFFRDFAALMYLPTTVTFRFTDILRGLVAQPILWAAGARLGFTDATVVQERNPHDYLQDFAQEVPMYLHTETSVQIAMDRSRPCRSIADNLRAVYAALADARIVATTELDRLEAWLADIADFQ